jgi:hypothetical protein
MLIADFLSGDVSGDSQQGKRLGASFFGAGLDPSRAMRNFQSGDAGQHGGKHEGQTPSATMSKLLGKRDEYALGTGEA